MLFTSWPFLFFFGVVLLGLRLCPSRRSRQILVLAASLYFYACWRTAYLALLAAPSLIDYWCALRIGESTGRRRRWFLWLSIASNLGLLAYFKYTNFFLGTLAELLGRSHRELDITLPVGISFFTFKALSYTIDVYRGEIPVCRNWRQYAMFITYFPELVAGPIVRASVFLPQIQRSLRWSWPRTLLGMEMVLLGVTKKLLVADRLAVFVDAVFERPADYAPLTVLMSIVAYSIQIYCDFSGYSDIAIGTSKIIGFDLPENFNLPYLATSLAEFWRRWHITLSSWLRDYLYIPLGGNRHGRARTYANLMITMLLGGLWHGANWTFVVWGLLHGAGLAISRAVGGRVKLPRVACWVLTYSFVCLTWIFFRARSFPVAALVLRKVLWLEPDGVAYVYSPLLLLLPLVIAGHWLGALARQRERSAGDEIGSPACLRWLYGDSPFAVRPHRWAGLYVRIPPGGFAAGFVTAAWLLMVVLFAAVNASPFIYFQF
jgi:alginate O-acetyltransferase complex protein AlgI